MIAVVKGQLVGTKRVEAEKRDGYDTKAHTILQVLQIDEKGNAELVKVKDYDMRRKWEQGKSVEVVCAINPWAMNGKNGIAIMAVE